MLSSLISLGLILTTAAADIADAPPLPQSQAHQQECMLRLVQFKNSMCFDQFYRGVVKCTGAGVVRDACAWTAIDCTNGVVRNLLWLVNHGDFLDIEWIPPTVRRFNVSYGKVAHPLNVRALPRSLIELTVNHAFMEGSLDTELLPPHMVDLSLVENALTGTIRLCALPPAMKRIDLRRNAFDKLIVLNSSLPASLERVQLSWRKQRISIVSLDGPVDPRVTVQHVKYGFFSGNRKKG